MTAQAVVAILQVMPRTQSIPVILYDLSRSTAEPAEANGLPQTQGIIQYLTSQDPADLLTAVNKVLAFPGSLRGA
jgi:hypothetical protein